MRKVFKVLALSTPLIIAVLAGCGRDQDTADNRPDPWGVVEVRRGSPIRIGVVTTFSEADMPDAGLELMRGAQLAAQEYGRINRSTVEIVEVNTGCSAEEGITAAEQMVNDPSIVAVLGPTCSRACLASVPIYDEANYSVVSPTCGASALTDQASHADVFLRTMYPDFLEVTTAAEFAFREIGARRAAIIHDDSSETADLAATFEAIFVSVGGQIVAKEAISSGDTDLQPVLDAVLEASPDLIYAPVLTIDASVLTAQRLETGLVDIPLLGGRYYWDPSLVSSAGSAPENLYAVGPVVGGEDYEKLLSDYARQFDERPQSYVFAHAYDAMWLILQAIEKAGSPGQGTLEIGRKALNTALYDTANYSGAAGNITCTAWGDCSTNKIGIGQIQDNTWIVTYIP